MTDTRYAVLGDIHANLPALDAVLDDIDGVDGVLCTGDIVGILGWNVEVVETIQDVADAVVMGNHDARVRSNFAYVPSFPAARDEHEVVTRQLDAEHIEWLDSLPERVETEEYILAHSRPVFQRDPGYPVHGFAQGDRGVMPRDFTRYGSHIDGKVALLGHTHEQHAVDMSKFPGQSGVIVNPGSVGVPWFGTAEYAIVDTDEQTWDLRSVEYENGHVEDRLESIGLSIGEYSNRKY